MLGARGFWNDDHAILAQQPSEGDLCRGHAAPAGNFDERPIAEHVTLAEWRIGHHGDLVVPAPGHEIPLGAAATKIVEHLVGRDRAGTWQASPFPHVRPVEVTDTVVADLAVALEPQKAFQSLGERDR